MVAFVYTVVPFLICRGESCFGNTDGEWHSPCKLWGGDGYVISPPPPNTLKPLSLPISLATLSFSLSNNFP